MNQSSPLVLLVEDELAVAKLVEFKLKRHKFRFEHRDNGKDGLDAIFELKPDIVILDIMLPSMNGFEILRNIRDSEEFKNQKVILLTTKNRVEDIKLGFGLEADEYMDKPFRPDELMMRIQKVLQQ